jgi:hypothetical protein
MLAVHVSFAALTFMRLSSDVPILLFSQEVTDSILGLETGYPDRSFHGIVLHSLRVNARIIRYR